MFRTSSHQLDATFKVKNKQKLNLPRTDDNLFLVHDCYPLDLLNMTQAMSAGDVTASEDFAWDVCETDKKRQVITMEKVEAAEKACCLDQRQKLVSGL